MARESVNSEVLSLSLDSACDNKLGVAGRFYDTFGATIVLLARTKRVRIRPNRDLLHRMRVRRIRVVRFQRLATFRNQMKLVLHTRTISGTN
jgi:hypothetical protein